MIGKLVVTSDNFKSAIEIIYSRLLNQLKIWRYCLISSFFLAFTITQDYLYNTLNIELTHELKASALEYSNLSAIFLYSLTFSLIPVGILYDKKPTEKLLFIGSLISILSAGIFYFSNSYLLFAINRVLCGLANAFAFIGGLKIIIAYYPTRTSLATGVLFALGNLGGLIASLPYVYLKLHTSWQTLLFVNFLLSVLICLFILPFLKHAKSSVQQYNGTKTYLSSLKDILKKLYASCKNYNNWLCGIYAGIFCLPDTLLMTLWGMVYLTNKFVLDEAQSGLIISCFVIGIAIGGPLLGALIDRKGKIKLIMALSSLFCAIILFTIINRNDLPFLYLTILFVLFGIIACSGIFAFSIAQITTPKSFVSTSLALVTLIMNLLNAMSKTVFGMQIDKSWNGNKNAAGLPLYTTDNIESAIVLIPIAFLFSIAVALFIRNYKVTKN